MIFGNINTASIKNDEILSSLLAEQKVELENFNYVIPITLKHKGDTCEYKLIVTAYPFLLRNIEIYGHCRKGSIFDISGQSKEPISFNVIHHNSGQYMFNDNMDIGAYAGCNARQNAETFIPQVINPQTELSFRFVHDASLGRDIDINTDEELANYIETTSGDGSPVASITTTGDGSPVAPITTSELLEAYNIAQPGRNLSLSGSWFARRRLRITGAVQAQQRIAVPEPSLLDKRIAFVKGADNTYHLQEQEHWIKLQVVLKGARIYRVKE